MQNIDNILSLIYNKISMDFSIYILIIPIVLFAIVIHEFSHGYTAYLLGDPTPKENGRLTLNPLKHIDPIGTILFPIISIISLGIGFGWAKPVPVNPYNFQNLFRDMGLVGAAGPISNLLFAYILSIPIKLGLISPNIFFEFAILINIALAIINLIPIPPLDGSRILMAILPEDKAYSIARLEKYGLILILALFLFGHRLLQLTLFYLVEFLYYIFTGTALSWI